MRPRQCRWRKGRVFGGREGAGMRNIATWSQVLERWCVGAERAAGKGNCARRRSSAEAPCRCGLGWTSQQGPCIEMHKGVVQQGCCTQPLLRIRIQHAVDKLLAHGGEGCRHGFHLVSQDVALQIHPVLALEGQMACNGIKCRGLTRLRCLCIKHDLSPTC